jgi:hypothetical protein
MKHLDDHEFFFIEENFETEKKRIKQAKIGFNILAYGLIFALFLFIILGLYLFL